jgi:hypothetical protein
LYDVVPPSAGAGSRSPPLVAAWRSTIPRAADRSGVGIAPAYRCRRLAGSSWGVETYMSDMEVRVESAPIGVLGSVINFDGNQL